MHSRQTKLQPLLPSCNESTNDSLVSSPLVNKMTLAGKVSKQVLYCKANILSSTLTFTISFSDHGPNTENARTHASSNLLNPLASVYSSFNELKFVSHHTFRMSSASLSSAFLLFTYVNAQLTSALLVH